MMGHLHTSVRELPSFHADYAGDRVIQPKVFNWALTPDVLEWILKTVAPDSRTLETGCGYSTVGFSILGTEHLAISPFVEEQQTIKSWCSRKQISTERVSFIARGSQDVIATMQRGLRWI